MHNSKYLRFFQHYGIAPSKLVCGLFQYPFDHISVLRISILSPYLSGTLFHFQWQLNDNRAMKAKSLLCNAETSLWWIESEKSFCSGMGFEPSNICGMLSQASILTLWEVDSNKCTVAYSRLFSVGNSWVFQLLRTRIRFIVETQGVDFQINGMHWYSRIVHSILTTHVLKAHNLFVVLGW